MENAFGDTWEDIDHRIHAFLLRNVRQLQHSQTVAEELTIEEPIHQVQLEEDVDETEGLAGEIPVHIRVMFLKEQAIGELV